MIPKTIHYCWFGRSEKPALAKKCIASWKKYCPDYEFVEWNEENFDVNCCVYTKEAYQAKKYAFVTDYVRLYAMLNYGGVYMDTDVELVRPIDEFLLHSAFSGFESTRYVPTGIMAAAKGLPIIEELLAHYDGRHFIMKDGSLDTTTNCVAITDTMLKYGLQLNGAYQVVQDFTFYPSDYFCPFVNETGELKKTKNTAAIHWFNKSWLPASIRFRAKITRVFHRYFGVNCFQWVKKWIS